MNTYREGNSKDPFTGTAHSSEARTPDENHDRPPARTLPKEWRRLPSGQRGMRLYQVTPVGGGNDYWVVETTLNGELLRRRFAGELHARAWLTFLTEPRPIVTDHDLEELNGTFRAAGVAPTGESARPRKRA